MTAEPVTVADPDDPRVADYLRLTDAAARAEHLFIAEGTLVIRQLLASPYPVRSVLLTPARLNDLRSDLSQHDLSVFLAEQPVMNAIAGFDIHRGAVAAAERLPLPTVADLAAGAGRLVVAEAITDHENMGALFRNAAAFGVDGLLLDRQCCDPLYRRAVRVSMGHVLRVPFTRVDGWPGPLADLGRAGFTVLALTPAADAEPIDSVVAEAGERWALVVGTEGAGLSEGAMAAATRRVRIPMAAGVDSLNVATAAAIALFALSRR